MSQRSCRAYCILNRKDMLSIFIFTLAAVSFGYGHGYLDPGAPDPSLFPCLPGKACADDDESALGGGRESFHGNNAMLSESKPLHAAKFSSLEREDENQPPTTQSTASQGSDLISQTALLPLKEGAEHKSKKNAFDVESTERMVSSVEAKDASIRIFKVKGMNPDKSVCHIQGVCRSGDGQYLLPHWMERYKGHIDSCGLPGNVRYVLHETKRDSDVLEVSAGRANKAPSRVWSVEGLRRKKMALTGNFSDHDLIGGKPPRELMHWLISDLTPSFYLIDMAARLPKYKARQCFQSEMCVESNEEYCKDSTGIPKLNPVVLVDVRVSEKKSHQWPKGVLRIMRNGLRGDLNIVDVQDVYGWQVRSKAACFRSIYSTSAIVADFDENLFPSSHVIWKANGLSRQSVVRETKSSEAGQIPTCASRVLLLNKYGKRYMVGHEKFHIAIAKATREGVEPMFPSIRVLSETVFFEKSSFHEQVSVMQESRVVVASHGSSSANIIFLRPGSSFIEVMPFGVEVDTYSNLAKAFGIKYTSIMAQPDEEVFVSCVEHFYPKNPAKEMRLLNEWQKAAKEFRAAAIDSRVNPATKYRISNDHKEDVNALRDSHFRGCAAYQRLSFNVDHVAKIALKHVMDQCGAIAARKDS